MNWLIAALASLSLTACFNLKVVHPGTDSYRREASKVSLVQAAQTETGGVTGSVNAQSNVSQLISAPPSSSLSGTDVTFPPGSLAISTSISLEESASVATDGMSAELELDTAVQTTGTPVVVQTTAKVDAQKPFSLSIPLPIGVGLALDDPWTNLVVMYRVKVEADNKTIVGVIPRAEISLENGVAKITTLYFGSFQAALTSTPVVAKKEVITQSVVLTKKESKELPALAITARYPFVANTNKTIEISGVNFRPTMMVALGGKKVGNLQVLSDSKASFQAPSSGSFGLSSLAVEQDGVAQSVSIFYAATANDYPIITDVEAEVCAGKKYYDATGEVRTGSKVCNAVAAPTVPNCTAGNAIDCVATSAYPTIDKSEMQSKTGKWHTSLSIAGIAGSLSDCAADGSGSCVVDGTVYKAAKLANYTAADVRSGVSIAGIAGSLVGAPAACSSDGQTSCLANSSYPAIDKVGTLQANASKIRSSVSMLGVAGTLDNCSSDGGAGCVVVGPTYAAALTTGLAAKIVNGQTVGGVNGTATASPADCASEGQTSCVAVANFPAVNKANITSNTIKMRSDLTIAGVSGTLADCSSDGGTSCVAVSSFPAVDKSALTAQAGKIRSSLTVATVTGSLADCSSDGGLGCVAVTNFPAMDKSSAPAKILSGQTLGAVVGTAAGQPANCAADGALGCVAVSGYPAMDASTAAAKILSGQTVAGVSGTAAIRPADCAADAATGCVAIANFPAANKSNLIANAAKIRDSLTVAGVSGSLADCSGDGESGCVAIGPTYAAALTTGAAAKILTGQSVAGVNGSAPIKPADCANDGGTDCVAVAAYPAALAAGASAKIVSGQSLAGVTGTASGTRPSDCASDGELGCVSIASFPAMEVAGAAAKIALGDTLAGVSGTASARPSDCAADGATNCVAITNFPAVDKVNNISANAAKIRSSVTIAGVAGTIADCSTDGGTDCFAVAAYPAAKVIGSAAKILTGQSVAGINGSAAIKPADCAADGTTGCVTVTNYPSVDKSALTANANKIRSSLSIAAVNGTLADCAADGGQGCVAVSGFPAANSTGAAAKIATGQTLAGINGTAAARPGDCALDGEIGCVSVTNYPAVDKVNALQANASKIRSSVTLAGVAGSLADCSSDGTSGCVAVAAFPVALASGAAAKILTGQTLAGVNGSAAIKPSDCAGDGATNCVAVTNYPAVDKVNALQANASKIRSSVTIAGVSGALSDCSADGVSGCVAVAAFPSALASGAAAKILTGQTLAGVNGSAAIKPSDCAGDGETNCVAISNFPAVDKTNNITANASKIRSSVTIAGVTGTLADCSSDNGTGCVAVTNFPSVNKLAINAGLIKSGTTIAGIAGQYPSGGFPLATATGTADLDAATFDIKIKSATAFEWFDSAGVRQTGAGDVDITPTNIKSGITIFGGTTGTFGSDCTGDGQTGCLTTSTYKSVDTSALTVWDIRSGKAAGGISGSLNFYKNQAKLVGGFNRTTLTGASSSTTVPDVYDTIDDYNNATTFPFQVPVGFPTLNSSLWLFDPAADIGGGGGIASDGTCNGTEECIYKDQITGIYWSKDDGSMRSWENAITACDGKVGIYSDWRLPTQKELMQAYINGIVTQKIPLNNSADYYWTATTDSFTTTNAWAVKTYGGGFGATLGKTSTYRNMCVRP